MVLRMTLTTEMRINGPVSPEVLWGALNDILVRESGPDFYGDTPVFTVDRSRWGRQDVIRTSNVIGQGLPALVWMNVAEEKVRSFHYSDEELDAEIAQAKENGWDFDPGPPAEISLAFDSPYGYQDEKGRGCGEWHRDLTLLVADVVEAMDGTWVVQAEGDSWISREDVEELDSL